MKLMPLLVSVTLISGCTVLPGSNMSTMGKDVIKQQDADFDLDKMVNVYPLTPRLIDQLRPRPNVARPNMTLESEIANYQYRVGPGTFLMSPSGITRNSPRQPVSTAAPATPATGYSLTALCFTRISARFTWWGKRSLKSAVILPGA